MAGLLPTLPEAHHLDSYQPPASPGPGITNTARSVHNMCWIQGPGFGILSRTHIGVDDGQARPQTIHASEYISFDRL